MAFFIHKHLGSSMMPYFDHTVFCKKFFSYYIILQQKDWYQHTKVIDLGKLKTIGQISQRKRQLQISQRSCLHHDPW
jgi:hypothetical protein